MCGHYLNRAHEEARLMAGYVSCWGCWSLCLLCDFGHLRASRCELRNVHWRMSARKDGGRSKNYAISEAAILRWFSFS